MRKLIIKSLSIIIFTLLIFILTPMVSQQKIQAETTNAVSVTYQWHVQSIGWQPWVSDGQEAGTDGRALRIEALEIRVVKTVNGSTPTPVAFVAPNPITHLETASNQTVSTNFNLIGWTLNSSGMSKVEVYRGTSLVGATTVNSARPDVAGVYPEYNIINSGFSCPINFNSLASGVNNLTVKSTGEDGTISYCNFVVNLALPRLSVDSPSNNVTLASITSSVSVNGWALNARGVSKVEILVDNVLKGTATLNGSRGDVYNAYKIYNNQNSGFTYALSTAGLTKTSHTILVKVTGNDGVVQTSSKVFNLGVQVAAPILLTSMTSQLQSLVCSGTVTYIGKQKSNLSNITQEVAQGRITCAQAIAQINAMTWVEPANKIDPLLTSANKTVQPFNTLCTQFTVSGSSTVASSLNNHHINLGDYDQIFAYKNANGTITVTTLACQFMTM